MDNYTIQSMSPQLLVTDIERAIAFYTEKLGFEISFRFEDFYAGIVKDGCSVHLKMGESLRTKADEDLDLTFVIADVDGIYAALVERGVDIRQPPRDMPYGRELYIADPDGNMLAFLQNG